MDGSPPKRVIEVQKHKRLTGLEEPHSSGKAQQHRTTAAEPTFRCDRCGGTLFDSVTKLLRHVKVEHEDTFAKTKKLVGHSSGSSSATLRCPTVYIDSPVKRQIANKVSKDIAEARVSRNVSEPKPMRKVLVQAPKFKRQKRVTNEDVYLTPWASNATPEQTPFWPVPLRLDYDWLRTMSKRAVSALRKTTSSKKDFMNMWNDFNLRQERMSYAAARNPCNSLRTFVIENRQAIMHRCLGVELVAHVQLFCHYGHITGAQSRELLWIFASGKLD